jgi:hypothetical protein
MDIKTAIRELKKHPEFHLLITELDKFVEMMYNIRYIEAQSRFPFEVEVAARYRAAQAVERLLKTWDALPKQDSKPSSQTFE